MTVHCAGEILLSAHSPEGTQVEEMSDMIDAEKLIGTWFHNHEADEGDLMVFVRQGTELPPSRGRTVLTLGADGHVSVGTPGPDDRPRDAAGGWELDGAALTIDAPNLVGKYLVVEVSAERLVIRRRN